MLRRHFSLLLRLRYHHALRHRTRCIGERIDYREMIGTGDFRVARRRLALPAVDDGAALAQELARLERAHYGIERASARHRPRKRRQLMRGFCIELQIGIDRDLRQRCQI